jgi:hypothetical protein
MVMTTQDQNKKTLRSFQCRDYLWEVFEQMSSELECSTDYLINEAMRQYVRSRNYGVGADAVSGEMRAQLDAGPLMHAGGAGRSSVLPPPPGKPRPTPSAGAAGGLPTPDLAATGIASLAASSRRSAVPPISGTQPSVPPPPPRPRTQPALSNPPPLPAAVVQHQQQRPGAHNTPVGRLRQLYIVFNGQKIPVSKEEFVIGRGSKSADLAIKDGNISRRHAAVVLQNGAHYLKDLGSTNGVEFQGRRFDSKRIEEGDLFRICDYELRFTYQ